MARASTISHICVDRETGEEIPRDEYATGVCFSNEHDHKPNPEWAITEDGVQFQKGDRVYNYYDGEWGTVEEDPMEGHLGWFDFRPDGKTHTKSLNSVRISSKEPRR